MFAGSGWSRLISPSKNRRVSAMISIRLALFALLAAPAAASAQSGSPASVRATIESVAADGASLAVRTRSGEEGIVRLKAKTVILVVVPASLAEVKPGAFVGIGALSGADGALRAMEVHIFPESMRGMGEGSHPFDLAPGGSMTNGAISARVDGVDGPTLTVTYRGGEQAIVVDAKTAIVGLESGAQSDLKTGAAIVAMGPRLQDGSLGGVFVLVGKDGLVPPM
jgi:hypothetical protein